MSNVPFYLRLTDAKPAGIVKMLPLGKLGNGFRDSFGLFATFHLFQTKKNNPRDKAQSLEPAQKPTLQPHSSPSTPKSHRKFQVPLKSKPQARPQGPLNPRTCLWCSTCCWLRTSFPPWLDQSSLNTAWLTELSFSVSRHQRSWQLCNNLSFFSFTVKTRK